MKQRQRDRGVVPVDRRQPHHVTGDQSGDGEVMNTSWRSKRFERAQPAFHLHRDGRAKVPPCEDHGAPEPVCRRVATDRCLIPTRTFGGVRSVKWRVPVLTLVSTAYLRHQDRPGT